MNRQLFQYHSTFGYHFVPGLKARVRHEAGGYLLRTNDAGFRCRHQFERERLAGTYRVLLFGDSYTAGDGVSDRHRYAEVLETLLPRVQVYNFGLSGSGTDQQYLIWREMAHDIAHDLVVIAILVENIRRVSARYRPFATPQGERFVLAKPYFTLSSDGSLKLHHVPVPKEPLPEDTLPPEDFRHVDQGGRLAWMRRMANRLGPSVKEHLQRLSGYQPVPEYSRPENPEWKLMRAILKCWTDEIKTPVVLCPIPLYQHIEETASAIDYQARFRELDQPPKVRVHDPLADFLDVPRIDRRKYRFEQDCHMTPAAHGVLAQSLARCIKPLLK